jgi:N-acylneuraminate cytidylyltransferase
MRTFAFIFARGGSKGLPRKNILELGGKPLIAHSIEIAKKVSQIEQVFVSTDDQEIAEISNRYSAITINRPVELATDNSPEWLSWQHAVEFVIERFGDFERFLSLPATAPLRNIDDVQSCLDLCKTDSDFVVTMTESNRSPWFNMVNKDINGRVNLLLKDFGDQLKTRQSAPKTFDMTTVAYVTSPSFILKNSCFWDGTVIGVEIPPDRAIDIDTKLDFEIANFLYSRKR